MSKLIIILTFCCLISGCTFQPAASAPGYVAFERSPVAVLTAKILAAVQAAPAPGLLG